MNKVYTCSGSINVEVVRSVRDNEEISLTGEKEEQNVQGL